MPGRGDPPERQPGSFIGRETALARLRGLAPPPGARSWAQRAETELRACGVAVTGTAADRDALEELTPQQREIVRLASAGLTNQQIGDRLFLSPRTVSSHLYRSYPKLGVTGRHQLRDVIARASTRYIGEPRSR